MIKILLFFIALYMGVLFYLYFTQNERIFNFSVVPKKRSSVVEDCKDCKVVKLQSADALLDGIYKDKNSSKLIIYFGGNSDDATEFIKYCQNLKDFDILIFNYRGNALSTGKPTQNDIFKDSLKIYDTYSKGKDVYLIGRSLGSGVASFLSSKREIKKLLLITPYDSIENVAKEKYPFFPISLLIKQKFNSLEYIKKCKAPVTVFEVKEDKTVSNERTENLLKMIRNLQKVVIFEDTSHADILDSDKFQKELLDWLEINED